MKGRSFQDTEYDSYRFGFNGMEKDGNFNAKGDDFAHYDFGARMYDARLGRWLSRDPLESKYASLSPYNFVKNSPLLFIDPDGKDILIHYYDKETGQNKSIKWSPSLKVVKGQEFLNKTINAINRIHGTTEGATVIETLSGSKGTFDIKQIDKTLKFSFFQPNMKKSLDEKTTAAKSIGDLAAIPINEWEEGLLPGGTISIGKKAIFFDGVMMTNDIVLGHELFHAYQRALGAENVAYLATSLNATEQLNLAELQAVGFENFLRAVFGKSDARGLYTGADLSKDYGTKEGFIGFSWNSLHDLDWFAFPEGIKKWKSISDKPKNKEKKDDEP